MDFTIEDVKTFLKAEKIQPSDLFGADMLADDPAVKGLVKAETREAVAGEYAHRKRTEEGFDKTRGDLEKKIEERDARIRELERESAKGKIGTLLDVQKGARKLDDKQEKFIRARLERFVPEKVEDLEKEFNTFLDAEIDEYERIAKDVFGIDPAGARDTGETDRGTGPDEGSPGGATKADDYIDPAKNPFIRAA